MKATPIILILSYLLISCMVAVGYIKITGKTDETAAVWIEEESIVTETPELEDDMVLQLMSSVTMGPTASAEPTATVTPGVSLKDTEAVRATVTPEATEHPVPTPEPTKEPADVVEITPTAVPEPTKVTEENRVNVKHNGKVIGYINTSYRMKEETLDQIVSMVREEPYISSFVLYDINTDAMICYNEERYFPVASTVKAPFVMTCLWQMEDGAYSLEDTMEYTSDYPAKGDGVIKKEDFGTVYTIKELVEHAILVSDDIGYLMLQGYFGHKTYNLFLKEMGNRVTIDGKNVKWGQTSTSDSLRNWQEIYRYINSESENAEFFAELLQNTNKSYIRNVLGEDYVIYNKMGWVYDQCCHDHAIIMDEQPYLMMIMTMGNVRAENQKFMEELAVILNDVHEEMVAE